MDNPGDCVAVFCRVGLQLGGTRIYRTHPSRPWHLSLELGIYGDLRRACGDNRFVFTDTVTTAPLDVPSLPISAAAVQALNAEQADLSGNIGICLQKLANYA